MLNMIIGVDAGCLGITDTRLKAGVYYVAFYLLRELGKIDNENTYLLYSFHPIEKQIMNEFPSSWKNIVLWPAKGWMYTTLPRTFLQKKPDVFLALSQAMPWYHPFRTIGFIHALDFIPSFHPISNTKLKTNSEYLITHADTIVTTSRFLKKSLETTYNRRNVIVSPLGIDKVFFETTTPYKLQRPYFLFIGSFKPSKNIPVILNAFSQFLKYINKPYFLVCIGSNYWDDGEILKTIRDLEIEDNILLFPSVEQKQLISYYKGALSLVSPSIYEGFGLPLLEAMASGCPVIASTSGAIPEIVGENGILVSHTDTNALTDAMVKMAKSEALRSMLITRGKKWAKQFLWEYTGRDIYRIINSYR